MNNKYFKMAGRNQKGQTIVEFALVFPVFLLIVLGIIELGHLMFVWAAVTDASREASRYAAGTGYGSDGLPLYRDCSGIMAVAHQYGFMANISATTADVAITYDNGNVPSQTTTFASCSTSVTVSLGDRIGVTVTGHYKPFVPLVPIPAINLTSTSYHTILSGIAIP